MRKNTHEPHARRLPALLALRSLVADHDSCLRRHLRSRLEGAASPRLPALARRPYRRFPRRPGGALPGPGIADRAVPDPAGASPHGAAPAAHDGGAAAPLVGRAAVSLIPGLAALRARLLGRPSSVLSIPAPLLRAVEPSADGAPHLHRGHLAMALPTGLWPGHAFQRLALSAAPLLPWCGLVVLVSRRPALPQPPPLVGVVAVSIS